MMIKVKSKKNGSRMVEANSVATFADLPQSPSGGQIEYVRETTGMLGLYKHAGWWQWDKNTLGVYGWKLIAKDGE